MALLFSSGARAAITQADCTEATATLSLSSQADVDNFPCTTVAGVLSLSSSATSTDPITSLSPGLDKLTQVDGLLKIDVDGITSLNGLGNVTHAGALSINEGLLTDISALGGLTSLGPRNCQPEASLTQSAACETQINIVSSKITQLPAWTIAGGTDLETLSLTGLPLADPTQLDDLPVPSLNLTLIGLPLDTGQPGQLQALERIAAAAKDRVTLTGMPNVKALPTPPPTSLVVLDNLAGITPTALSPIRNVEKINITNKMPGLAGPNPLAGLAGGTFSVLTLQALDNVGTLADLSTVTSLDNLIIVNNATLTDLEGLQNLTTIQRLTLRNNPTLQNLNGLRGLTGTVEFIEVIDNKALTDINGLAGITGVSDRVQVYSNAVTECDVLVKTSLNPVPSGFSYYVDPPCDYAAPTLTSSATALDFGSAPIGSMIDKSVTFQNSTGSISTTVDISALSISGDSLNEYSVLSEDCTPGKAENPLTGGSTRNTCTVTVRFTVIQQGVDNAQLDLTYTTSDNSTPQTFPVTLHAAGTGVTGDQLTPNTNLDFGQVELGASKTDTITIDNTSGSGPLTVSALTVTGDFTISNNSCGNTYPQAIAVGNTCDVSIQFAPSGLGARSGLFTMNSDGATSPDSVNLLGSGVKAPAPVPSTSSIDFGDVVRGTTAAQSLTVSNEGPLSSLPLGQLSASSDFAVQADTCSGTTLAPAGQAGDSCSVSVVFAPTTVGPATGTLTIPGASGLPAASVALAGEGLEPATLTASPTLLDFGVQTTATTLAVTITNIGGPGQDAQIGTASVTGTVTPRQFGIGVGADNCSGTTLASQASCQISVIFNPDVEGVDTGSLDIPYNSGQTFNVALSGRGGDPVDYITPASLSFGDIEIGSSSAPQTVTVTDNSGIALDIASVFSNDSAFSVQNDSCSGTTVAPNTSCTFEVVFTAVTRGHKVSTVDVRSNSASSPDQVAVDGYGLAPPELHLSEPTVDFGAVAPGGSSSETITVTNYGDEDLVIGTLSLGPAMPDFALSADACSGVTLAAGANCSFTIDYSPSGPGQVTSTVTLPSNAANSPSTLNLIGVGTVSAPVPVPTLSEWMRLALPVLLVLIGMYALRRRAERQ
jgi:hypothetical protein